MTLGQYIELLKQVIEANPAHRDLEVISASDDEGNNYQAVNFEPTLGYCKGEYYKEFVSQENFEEYAEEQGIELALWSDLKVNCICIN